MSDDKTKEAKGLNIGLWIAQFLVGAIFIMAGATKLTQPVAALSINMAWTADYPEAFVRLMGAIDLAGGLGLLLPALTRVKPGLTVLAAAGCLALQICAMIFHASRGEMELVPFNVVLAVLSAFILWGRRSRAPIRSREAS